MYAWILFLSTRREFYTGMDRAAVLPVDRQRATPPPQSRIAAGHDDPSRRRRQALPAAGVRRPAGHAGRNPPGLLETRGYIGWVRGEPGKAIADIAAAVALKPGIAEEAGRLGISP
jgi:hypothetical protein